MAKKQKYVDLYASVGKNDYFGTVFDGMCKSDAYKNLSLSAKHFYTLCRVQSQSKHGRQCLYKHSEESERNYNDNDFVFPSSHLKLYGIDRGNAKRYFDELIKAGFVDRKECNKVRKKMNVYSFSNRWKNTS